MVHGELNRICVMLKPCYTTFRRVVCILSLMAICTVGSPAAVFAESSYQSATKSAVISVPDGQILHAIVTTPINSKYINSGQTVSLVLGKDFCYNSKMIAPVDSMIYGTVISVTRSQKNKPAEILLRFNQIVTPYGLQIPLAAIVKTTDNSGKINGATAQYSDGNGNIDIQVAKNIDLILTQPITVNHETYSSNY